MQPVGTCHRDVSLTGVRHQTNYHSALHPSCLSISFGFTYHVTLRLFSKILVFKVNLRLELVQARRCVPVGDFGGGGDRSPEVGLSLGCHGVDLQRSSACVAEDACRQLRAWELLMKPTALPANYPGSPTGWVIKMGTGWV